MPTTMLWWETTSDMYMAFTSGHAIHTCKHERAWNPSLQPFSFLPCCVFLLFNVHVLQLCSLTSLMFGRELGNLKSTKLALHWGLAACVSLHVPQYRPIYLSSHVVISTIQSNVAKLTLEEKVCSLLSASNFHLHD